MNGDFLDALRQIEKEKEIPMETLIETIEAAIASAYKKAFSEAAEIRLRPDPAKRGLRLCCEKEVVETVENPHREMGLAEARRRNPSAVVGDFVDVDLTADGFGRIAAQTAKQVVVQRIREAEREKVYEDFSDRLGDVVTGTLQRKEHQNAFITLGKVEALLPASEQVRQEPYRFNDRIKVYVLEVKRTSKGPQVIVSRTHPSLIRRLFELEVPEIADGVVVIKSVAREAGARSKIAVASTEDKVDPVGACVGHRGSRVQAVVNELYGEKIDIVRWYAQPEEYITQALSPAKVMTVTINDEQKSAFVVVPDNQLSLAIGKEGQNVRLAARLTGWRIDIRSESQVREKLEHDLAAAEAATKHTAANGAAPPAAAEPDAIEEAPADNLAVETEEVETPAAVADAVEATS
jgi:N utilization substance protein A